MHHDISRPRCPGPDRPETRGLGSLIWPVIPRISQGGKELTAWLLSSLSLDFKSLAAQVDAAGLTAGRPPSTYGGVSGQRLGAVCAELIISTKKVFVKLILGIAGEMSR